ncbi:sensor histidine kinase [Kordiimonas aquimaris]|uniref:sensor histidine kinase n=1 Tax=Kordiimonas aquimaris TaxID=707591 RepID=UPI0021CFA14B|nr:ATP-binding protein [Kordiimonas aquimaris]
MKAQPLLNSDFASNRPVSKADIPDPIISGVQRERWLRVGRFLSMKQSAAVFLLGLIVVLSGSLSYVFYQSVNNLLMSEIQKRAQSIAENVAESAQFGVLLSDRLTLIQLAASYMEQDDVRYIWIVDEVGTPILPGAWSIEKLVFNDALIKSVLTTGLTAARQTNLGTPVRGEESFDGYHVAVPVWYETYDGILDVDIDGETEVGVVFSNDRTLIGMVQVGLSLESVHKQARLTMLRSGLLVAGVTFLTLVVAATLLHRWLEPLQVVTAMATRIRERGYDEAVKNTNAFKISAYDRSAVHGRVDEIGQLYQTFTEMMQELARHDKRLKEQKEYLKQMVTDQTAKLMVAKEAAEAANRSKSTFLASMSHEIRTPLNAVLGYTEILKSQPDVTEEQRAEHLNLIQASGHHLLILINDILDLSELEAGNFEVQKSTFQLNECIDPAISINKHAADEKHIVLNVSVQNVRIKSDEKIIRQMLVNLVSNAVKFTPDEGKVDVFAKIVNGQLMIEVCDTGIGMSDAEISRAEQLFEQGEGLGHTKKIAGAGLGLPLVRRLAAVLNGKMYIYSEKGVGTVVRLRIPITENEAQ